jgi:hypothetical protein
MSDVFLVLGPVAFNDFEIPERIVFGGAQRLAVHKLPGGLRVIDALGRDDRELSWSGIFTGSNATERARLLDVLRVQGTVLPLTWDVFFYSVVIAAFEAEYRHGWWIPYRLTCTVLSDEATAAIESNASAAGQALSDLGSAAQLTSGAGIDLSAVQAAAAVAGATTPTTEAYAEAVSMVNQAQTLIGTGITGAEAQLAPIITGETIPGTSYAAAGVAALSSATSATGQLAALTAAMGYVSRTVTNLKNAGK